MLCAVRAALFVVAFALLAGAAHADEKNELAGDEPMRAPDADALPLELTWNAPTGCATADDIRREVARIAHARPGRSLPRVSAEGRIERWGEGYRLTLHTFQNGVRGERSLLAKECRSLEREVTLVLALSFGEGVEIVDDASADGAAPAQRTGAANAAAPTGSPGTSTAPATTETREPSTKASTTASATPAPSATSPTRDTVTGRAASSSSSASGLNTSAVAGGGVLFGTLPSPAATLFAGADLAMRRFDVDPRFVWIPGVDQTLPRGVHARHDGFGGSLSGCIAVPPFEAMLGGCVGFEALALRGRSSGASEAGESVAPFFGLAPAVRWQWPAKGFVALRFEAALHIALNEPRFVVVGLGEAYSVPRLAPSLGAALLLRPDR
jgi:hypothetical protein